MKIGFIDYYLDEWHANNFPTWIKELSDGEMEVAYAYAEIDSPHGGKTTDEWCADLNIQRINSISELVEKSDAIMVLAPDNPETHERLSKTALQSGKPVFIDKIFAETTEIAKRIFSTAQEHNTPCFTCTSVRYASEYLAIDKTRIAGITARGNGKFPDYAIHQVEPVISLMGTDIRQVIFTGTEKCPAYVIEYNDGRKANISHHGNECPFGMVVDFTDGTSLVTVVESEFFKNLTRDMIDFFRTGDVKVPHEETIAVIAVIEILKNQGMSHGFHG